MDGNLVMNNECGKVKLLVKQFCFSNFGYDGKAMCNICKMDNVIFCYIT